MLNFASRNLKIFFRQKSAVFFSLLGVFIIIGLYVLFLGDVWVNDFSEIPGVRALMDSWIIAGIVSVTSATTAMGAFGLMVEDKVGKQSMDFTAAPIKRTTLVGGYVLSACTVGFLMSVAALVLGEIYLMAGGAALPDFLLLLKILGITALCVLASSAMVFFMVSFFTGASAFSTASSVIGTLIGFITGIYLPIGSLPEAVQWVVKCFPMSHAGALLRQTMMADTLSVSFAGAPQVAVSEFQGMMGVTYTYGSYTAEPWVHLLVLAGTAIVFFLLAVWNVSRKKKG